MRKRARVYASAILLASCLLRPAWLLADPVSASDPASASEPPDFTQQMDTDTQQILEKSLSIVEIDREIGKIEQQQQQIEQSIEQSTSDIAAKEKAIADSRSKAGERLKAYYMGEREDLLAALLSTRSLKDFLSIADYIGIIFDRDQNVISTYKRQYDSLKDEKNKLQEMNGRLAAAKTDLLQQRSRVLALQEEVGTSLQNSSNPQMLEQMIQALNDYWNTTGLAEVRKYFNALDKAMKDFPDFLQKNGGSLSSSGLSYTLTIKQEDLNQFLRSKNKLFEHFSFTFAADKVIAQGQEGDMSLKVVGHYTISNQPQNAILFHVDQLVFNGLSLPDTTARELEQDFDLGFYPGQIMPLIKATSVELEDGTLVVKLKLAL